MQDPGAEEGAAVVVDGFQMSSILLKIFFVPPNVKNVQAITVLNASLSENVAACVS